MGYMRDGGGTLVLLSESPEREKNSPFPGCTQLAYGKKDLSFSIKAEGLIPLSQASRLVDFV